MISFVLVFLLPLVSALFPQRRSAGSTACGQFDTISSGSYSLLTNHWGQASATSGSQCSTLKSVRGDAVSWFTYWDWKGEDGIKSFSNMQRDDGVGKQLSAIKSMQSTWNWSQSNNGHVVSDAAYDFFIARSPGGENTHEVMVWLHRVNSGPISYHYNEKGEALPVATNIKIGGYNWNLYAGSNRHNPVYSFLPTDDSITMFRGDMYAFFKYLSHNGHVSLTEYLKTAQAGVEATCGNATFETLVYELSIN